MRWQGLLRYCEIDTLRDYETLHAGGVYHPALPSGGPMFPRSRLRWPLGRCHGMPRLTNVLPTPTWHLVGLVLLTAVAACGAPTAATGVPTPPPTVAPVRSAFTQPPGYPAPRLSLTTGGLLPNSTAYPAPRLPHATPSGDFRFPPSLPAAAPDPLLEAV